MSYESIKSFLSSIYPQHYNATRTTPFVTLTYAQSLDGKISGPDRSQIKLSGKESMMLTHKLREMHDSILVGVGTVLTDDPQLTARLPDLLPLSSQPQPIILDTQLRIPQASRFFKNAQEGKNHAPVIVCGENGYEERKEKIEEWGGKVESCDLEGRHIFLPSLLRLPSLGNSLMVEGGATVISSFLASGLFDLLVITIAPVLIGDGICMTTDGLVPPTLEFVDSKMFGNDIVAVYRPGQK